MRVGAIAGRVWVCRWPWRVAVEGRGGDGTPRWGVRSAACSEGHPSADLEASPHCRTSLGIFFRYSENVSGSPISQATFPNVSNLHYVVQIGIRVPNCATCRRYFLLLAECLETSRSGSGDLYNLSLGDESVTSPTSLGRFPYFFSIS